MNNGMNNTKEKDIRRPIAILLLVVFCLAVFASPVAALQHDPNNWQVVDMVNPVSAPESDDGGWNDGQSKSIKPDTSMLGCYDIRITAPMLFLWFLDIVVVDTPDSPDQDNDNDRPSLDQIRTTSPQ
jgi:hypothetical protein